jgi:hypothetical protein
VPRGATFAFGASPFRVKGGLYANTQTYFEKEIPGGVATLYAEIGDGPLRDFISQRFLVSSRYDVMPVPALIAHEARATNADLATYLRRRTAYQANADIHGVYRVLLALASPDRVIERLPKLLVQMFDFATVDFEDHGEGVRVATFGGIPEPLEPWLRIGFSVYAETALRFAGAKDVDASFLDSADEGTKVGLPIRRMRLRIVWT